MTATESAVYLCPVCESRCKIDRDYMDYTLCESLEECPNCDYVSRFAYGSYSLYVGGNEWHWSYKESVLEEKSRQVEIKQAIDNAKRLRMTTTDPEYAALLRGILDNPADDAPRLIIADWLEEHGEEERALWIREQCLSADLSYDARIPSYKIAKHYLGPELPDSCRVKFNRGFVEEISLTCREFMGEQCAHCQGTGVLGYPKLADSVRDCPICNKTGCRIPGVARELFEQHPITTVRLTCRKPGYYMNVNRPGDSWYWVRGTRETMHFDTRVPVEISKHLVGYFYEEDGVYQFDTETALDALSDACVAYGRDLVGLPLLESK